MKYSRCRTLSWSLAAAVLAGCSAAQPTVPAPQGAARASRFLPAWQATHAAHPACAARAGAAQCLVLILGASARSGVAGWTPADFQKRYKLPSRTKGKGQIVAIVDAYDNPKAASDLAAYRSQFGLGKAAFSKYNQRGQKKNYPAGSMGWGVEIDLDAQMVSASCPLCKIYLIEADSAASADLETAEAVAAKLGARIVSNSWICYGSPNCVAASYFDTPGVEYLAASGDEGYGKLGAPSVFESVAAIGGTVLTRKGGKYEERVWSGSGGGCAALRKPPWQHDTICEGRAVGDASAVAWNAAMYDSYGYGGWFTVGGTSVSTPLLAGVFGLAGNARKQDGGRTFWLTAHRKDLYRVCSSCLFSQYSYGGGWGSPDGTGAF